VWKFVLAGRRNDSSEQIHNWKFEGSNGDSDLAIIHSETSYPIDSSTHQFNVENNTFIIDSINLCSGRARTLSWSSHMQIFVCSD